MVPRIFRLLTAGLGVLLLWSVYSGWWSLATLDNFYEIGPRGVRYCRGVVCTWGDAERLATGDSWGLLGTTTLVSTSLAACGLFFLCVLSGKRAKWVARAVAALCLFGLGLGVSVAAKAPLVEGMQHTFALASYFIATGAGIAASTVVFTRSSQESAR